MLKKPGGMWRRRGQPEEDSAVCASLVIRTLRDCGVGSGEFCDVFIDYIKLLLGKLVLSKYI